MDIFDRIALIIENERLNTASFERAIGVSNATIGKAMERRKGVSSDVLIKILETFLYISPDWLLLGKGEMLREKVQNCHQDDHINMVSLEKYEKKVEECALLRAELNSIKTQPIPYAQEGEESGLSSLRTGEE